MNSMIFSLCGFWNRKWTILFGNRINRSVLWTDASGPEVLILTEKNLCKILRQFCSFGVCCSLSDVWSIWHMSNRLNIATHKRIWFTLFSFARFYAIRLHCGLCMRFACFCGGSKYGTQPTTQLQLAVAMACVFFVSIRVLSLILMFALFSIQYSFRDMFYLLLTQFVGACFKFII